MAVMISDDYKRYLLLILYVQYTGQLQTIGCVIRMFTEFRLFTAANKCNAVTVMIHNSY